MQKILKGFRNLRHICIKKAFNLTTFNKEKEFKQLSRIEICKCAALKQVNILGGNINKLSLSNCESLKTLIIDCETVETLKISECEILTEVSSQGKFKNLNLNVLNLDKQIMQMILRHVETLQKLKVCAKYNFGSDFLAHQLFQHIRQSKEFEKVTFKSPLSKAFSRVSIESQTLKRLQLETNVSIYVKCPYLNSLDVSVMLPDPQMIAINATRLDRLEIRKANLATLKLISSLSTLTFLKLNRVKTTSIPVLRDCDLSSLTTLVLNASAKDNSITFNNLQQLLSSAKKLKRLFIDGEKRKLREGRIEHNNLVQLTIYKCNLLETLTIKCPKLVYLSITDCARFSSLEVDENSKIISAEFTSTGITPQTLVSVIQKMKRLQYLNVKKCKQIPDSVQSFIAERMPKGNYHSILNDVIELLERDKPKPRYEIEVI